MQNIHQLSVKDAKIISSLIQIMNRQIEKESEAIKDYIDEEIQNINLIEGPIGPPGPPGGPEGPPGPQGRGINEAVVTDDGLFFTYTDGKKQFIGEVRGPQGARGSRGEQGPPGERGPIGFRGPVGPQGKTGPTGPKGDTGERGLMGPAGIQGPAGPLGPTGLRGPKGDPGERGIQGATGTKGEAGPPGPQGPKGDPGNDADVAVVKEEIETLRKEIDNRISRLSFNIATRSPGSGEVWLKFLDDVDRSSLESATNGQALVYNSTSGKWEAGSVVSAGGISNAYAQANFVSKTSTAPQTVAGVITFQANTNFGTNTLTVDTTNNRVGVNTPTPDYDFEVNGSFAATTKSFIINHPTKPGKKLRYGSLEGPENGVYVRGRTTTHTIYLPDYWVGLVDENSITVHLTPIGSSRTPSIKKIENNKIYLTKSILDDTLVIDCYYVVYAERKDVKPFEVEF